MALKSILIIINFKRKKIMKKHKNKLLILFLLLLILLSSKEKAENSTDISNSWFSYKTLIPVYILYLSSDIAILTIALLRKLLILSSLLTLSK